MDKQIRIFYSWQSDLPPDQNQRVIRKCLKTASLKIDETRDDIALDIDEATRGEAGSPSIPEKIFEKISKSDIFVADITTINHDDTAKRKTPNPNVLIELGYAIAFLGWERIIMVFNKSIGEFPVELPFDLEKRRISVYSIKDRSDANGIKNLEGTLKEAISTIIQKNPSRNIGMAFSEDISRRERDIKNLENILLYVNLPLIDSFITQLPDTIIKSIFFFWESFQGVYDSSSFHIYDHDINLKLVNFKNSWNATLNYGQSFYPSLNGDYYKFNLIMDSFPDEVTKKDYQALTEETMHFKDAYKEMVNHIRDKYIEIDLDQLSKQGDDLYKKFNQEMLNKFGE